MRYLPLLQSGAVMGRQFQPHESHIPYLLQVKVDFNLFGMGFVRLAHCLFRCSALGAAGLVPCGGRTWALPQRRPAAGSSACRCLLRLRARLS